MKHNRSFVQSVRDALHGIVYTAKTERNFRFELVIALIVLPGVFFVPLTMVERVGVWLVVCAVLFVELINTAIERAVDVATQKQNETARCAKDTAAAAVLVVVVGAFGYACFLVWNIGQRLFLF